MGGATAKPSSVTATTANVVVPTTAQSGPVTITTPGGTATSPVSFTLLPQSPTIGSISPASGPVATTIKITGTNLLNTSSIGFAGGVTATPATDTLTSVTVVVPSGAATGVLFLTTPGGTVKSGTFTVIAPPTITAIAPNSQKPGAAITITGTALTSASLVTFTGGATSVPTSVNPTSARVVVPAAASSGVIGIKTPGGTGTSTVTLTVT